MAHYSGIANDFAALVGVLRSACVDQGWTLSGDVLHKGNAYARVRVATSAQIWTEHGFTGSAVGGTLESLFVTAGTGIDGSNNLTDRAAGSFRIGGQNMGGADVSVLNNIPFTFPVNYEVHIHGDPDEVFLIVNHDVDRYQHLSFGHNPVAEATGGSGCWVAASMNPWAAVASSVNPSVAGIFTGPQCLWPGAISNPPTSGNQAPSAPCFGANPHNSWWGARDWAYSFLSLTHGNGRIGMTHTIHHGVDGVKWSGSSNPQANVSVAAVPKLNRGINQIDGSAPLIRPIAMIARGDAKVSTVAQFEHYRLVRIDNLLPGQIVEIGPDRWKVYPWHRKTPDGSFPLGNGNNRTPHTGYLGWAVRYDGP